MVHTLRSEALEAGDPAAASEAITPGLDGHDAGGLQPAPSCWRSCCSSCCRACTRGWCAPAARPRRPSAASPTASTSEISGASEATRRSCCAWRPSPARCRRPKRATGAASPSIASTESAGRCRRPARSPVDGDPALGVVLGALAGSARPGAADPARAGDVRRALRRGRAAPSPGRHGPLRARRQRRSLRAAEQRRPGPLRALGPTSSAPTRPRCPGDVRDAAGRRRTLPRTPGAVPGRCDALAAGHRRRCARRRRSGAGSSSSWLRATAATATRRRRRRPATIPLAARALPARRPERPLRVLRQRHGRPGPQRGAAGASRERLRRRSHEPGRRLRRARRIRRPRLGRESTSATTDGCASIPTPPDLRLSAFAGGTSLLARFDELRSALELLWYQHVVEFDRAQQARAVIQAWRTVRRLAAAGRGHARARLHVGLARAAALALGGAAGRRRPAVSAVAFLLLARAAPPSAARPRCRVPTPARSGCSRRHGYVRTPARTPRAFARDVRTRLRARRRRRLPGADGGLSRASATAAARRRRATRNSARCVIACGGDARGRPAAHHRARCDGRRLRARGPGGAPPPHSRAAPTSGCCWWATRRRLEPLLQRERADLARIRVLDAARCRADGRSAPGCRWRGTAPASPSRSARSPSGRGRRAGLGRQHRGDTAPRRARGAAAARRAADRPCCRPSHASAAAQSRPVRPAARRRRQHPRRTPEDLLHFALDGIGVRGAHLEGAAADRGAAQHRRGGRQGRRDAAPGARAPLRGARASSSAGNVEGRDVPLGLVDVVVCPGPARQRGAEAAREPGRAAGRLRRADAARAARWRLGRWLLRDGIERVSTLVFDYASYGGAPILGFERIVIKAHGRSHVARRS